MKVEEIMERAGIVQTGKAISYIKDGLNDMNLISETHVDTVRVDININQRFYDLPGNAVKILDIRCKHHNNSNSKYQSIPRMTYEPETEGTDGF